MSTETWNNSSTKVWNQSFQQAGGSMQYSSGITNPGFVNTWTRTSVRTPGYHDPNRVGRLPSQPFSYEKEVKDTWHGSLLQTNASKTLFPGVYAYYYLFQTGYTGGAPEVASRKFTVAEMAAADAIATNKLLDKIKNQKVSIAQVIAERNMTMNLVTTTISRFGTTIRALRKGDFVSAARALGVKARKRAKRRFNKVRRLKGQERAVASGWLELQYGWKPLLMDIHGSCEVLANAVNDVAHGGVTASHTLVQDNTKTVKVSASQTVYSEGQGSYTCKYGVRFTSPYSSSHTLASLGLTNPLAVGWEMVPFSFVVDWFLPVGTYLSNLDATLGLQFESGFKTTFHRVIGGAVEVIKSPASDSLRQSGLRNMSYLYVKNVRTKLTSFPSPCIPAFKNPFSFTHMANALALLTTLFKKR